MTEGSEFIPLLNRVFTDVRTTNEEQHKVCCPRCQENEGLSEPDGKYNLEINTKERIFHCWKCDPSFAGNLEYLIKIFGSKYDIELYKSIVETFGYFVADKKKVEFKEIFLPKEFILFSEMDIDFPSHQLAYNYMMVERKISWETLLEYNVGFCVGGYYDNRILIPSYNMEGKLNYFSTRTFVKEKPPYRNPKADRDVIVFNENKINWDATVYLVEGPFDMLSFPINTIPLLGKELLIGVFNKLLEHQPDVIVILDPDALSKAVDLFELLFNNGFEDKIKLVELKGKDDLDEIRRKFGDDRIIDALYSARTLNEKDYRRRFKRTKKIKIY